MKYCPKCGSKNPSDGAYCMSCGQQFLQEILIRETKDESTPSESFPQIGNPPPPYSQPLVYVQPIREKYGNLIDHSSYQHFINGSLALTLGPIISVAIGLFLGIFTSDESILSFLGNLVDPIAYLIFIFGIYSIAQLEPRSLNDQLKNVSVYLTLFAILNYFSGLLFGMVPTIAPDVSIEELRTIVVQGLVITLVQTGSAVVFVIGANSFTKWFEQLVMLLEAPPNAPTNRIRWLAICQVIGSASMTMAFLMLINALDNLSISTVESATLVIGVGAIFTLAAIVLQVAGGYKIYSVLNNIRKGKYDGTYQRQIMEKYQ